MIPVDQPHLEVAGLSHPGEKRDHNEDRFLVQAFRRERDGKPALLALVADGIGGHQAGEVAAELTVATIRDRLAESPGRDPIKDLARAVAAAGEVVYQASQEADERQGMGSTVAAVWIIGDRLYTASVGDSRIYLWRRGRLQQLTVDHTWLQEALEYRIIRPEEAEGHPHAHVLRRYVGGPRGTEPDLRLRLSPNDSNSRALRNQGHRLRPGDRLLLCSDGLTDLVRDEEIAAELAALPPSQVVANLVETARARGGHDNITAVAIAVPGEPPRSRAWLGCAALLVAVAGLVAFVGAGLAAAWWFGLWPWQGAPRATATAPSATMAPPAAAPPPTAAPPAAPSPTPPPTASPTPAALRPTSTPVPLPTVSP